MMQKFGSLTVTLSLGRNYIRHMERYQRSRFYNSDVFFVTKTAAEIVKQETLIVMRTPGVHAFGHRPDGKLIVRTSLPHMVPDSIEGISVVKEYCEGFIPMSQAITSPSSVAKDVGPDMLVCNKNLYAFGSDGLRLIVRGSEQGLKLVPESISGFKVDKKVCDPFIPCGSSVQCTTPHKFNHSNSIDVHTFHPGSNDMMTMRAHIACKVRRTVSNEELLLACGHTHHAPAVLPFKTRFMDADRRASYSLDMDHQAVQCSVTEQVIMSDNMDVSLSRMLESDQDFPTPFTGVATRGNLKARKWRFLVNGEEREAVWMENVAVTYPPWTNSQYFPSHWRDEGNKWIVPVMMLREQLLFSVDMCPGESGGVLVDEDNRLLAYGVAHTVDKETGLVVGTFSPVHPIFEKLGLTLVTNK